MSTAAALGKTDDRLNRVAGAEAYLAPSRASRARTVLAGATVVALVTFCFFLLFWNRFLGLRSGDGGFTGGLLLLKGFLPYRDYYAAVPPLFGIRCAAVLAVFGKLPIVLRGFGVFERAILGLVLYAWLARFFRATDAALASLVTVVLSTGDFADPVSSYNHFTILLAVATGFVASYALDEERTNRFLLIVGSLTGLFSLLCLATKQTIGLAVTVALPAVVGGCMIRLGQTRKSLRFLFGFLVGWSIGAAALIGWMSHAGILHPFLVQAFVTGPAAKASHSGDFITRSFTVIKDLWWAALIALPVLAIGWAALGRSENEAPAISSRDSLKDILLVMLLGLAAIGASTVLTWRIVGWPLDLHLPADYILSQNIFAKPAIYISLIGSGLLTLLYLWRFLARRLTRRQSQFALLATIAFIIASMTSLSWPAFEAMIIPGFGLILAILLHDLKGARRWLVYAVCAVLICSTAMFKQGMPFGFNGWYEPPVKVATATSSLPELRGFLLPANTVDFVDSTIRIIREHTSPQDKIFIYPDLGFFYGATERRPATFSGSHNIDVAPDSFARQEAQRLLQARPAALIYGPKSDELLRADERYWRDGKPSGQRDLIAAVETLAREYKVVRMFRMYPFGEPVYIFLRPDVAAASGMTTSPQHN